LDFYNSGSLDSCGKCLGIKREENETDGVYKMRIVERINKVPEKQE